MKPRELRPGEVVYLCSNEKLHYIGVAESAEDKVHVFWGWNQYKKRRYYKIIPDDCLGFYWKYMDKKLPK